MRTLLVSWMISLSVLAAPEVPTEAKTDSPSPRRRLRVCADPNNLPFSNQAGEGFENKLAELVARELDADVHYTWWAQRRGFFRNTLRAGRCDVVMGVPTQVELARPTKPYYRSTYAFVFPKDRPVRSLDDPKLRTLKIGVQVVGDDGANTPPVTALSRRGIVDNVRGYSVVGDYRLDSPPSQVVEAVRRGEVDVAIAWGPLAGYFARRGSPPLEIALFEVAEEPAAPFAFDISMGTRRKDTTLHAELEAVLIKRRKEIDALLAEYGIPRVDAGGAR